LPIDVVNYCGGEQNSPDPPSKRTNDFAGTGTPNLSYRHAEPPSSKPELMARANLQIQIMRSR
jgi:hypothetical protein